ncbi:MAG: DUF2490 domain-containing protein [Cytophagaceae bacterium]|jgi:hypothetical protein|nr:DUF2490 domain-containing protein [Cytophagaceae bacterium]
MAQTKEVEHEEQLWLQTNLRIRVAKKWFAYIDGGFRTREHFIQERTQYFIRPASIFQVSNKVQLWGGYAYFETSQWINGYNDVFRPEHRYWNFVTIRESFKRFELRHRYRLEGRWQQGFQQGELTDSYDFFWRFGYQFQIVMALNNEKIIDNTWFLIASDELMVNAGKTINNYFDQNRISAGVGYNWNEHFRIQGIYQYIYAKQSRGETSISGNSIWITLQMNVDIRKKTE